MQQIPKEVYQKFVGTYDTSIEKRVLGRDKAGAQEALEIGLDSLKNTIAEMVDSFGPNQQQEIARKVEEGDIDGAIGVFRTLTRANFVLQGSTAEKETIRGFGSYADVFRHTCETLIKDYVERHGELPQGVPEDFNQMVMGVVRQKAGEVLRGGVEPVAAARPAAEAKLVIDRPAPEVPGTHEQKITAPQTRQVAPVPRGEIYLPERPVAPQKEVDRVNPLLSREDAEKMLGDIGEKTSARDRAWVKSRAEVKSAMSEWEKQARRSGEEYKPYGFYLSDLIQKYEEAQARVAEKIRKGIIDSSGRVMKKDQVFVIDYSREERGRDPDYYIASSMQKLMAMIERRSFEDEELADLRKDIDGFRHVEAVTPEGESRAEETRRLQNAISNYAEGITSLIKYWREGITGEELLQLTPKGAGKKATQIMNEVMYWCFQDPDIERAFHLASTKSLDETHFRSTIGQFGNRFKRGFITEIMPDGKTPVRVRMAESEKEIACNTIGEMLHTITLKVRCDPAQAGTFAYTVYKNDQLGLQHWEGKYRAREFQRALKVDRAGNIHLINNNEMATLFTFENSAGLADKWLDLIRKSVDCKTTGIFIGRRNLAALIGWGGDYDPRTPDLGLEKPGEALELEHWLALGSVTKKDGTDKLPAGRQADLTQQDEMLLRHLRIFLDDTTFSSHLDEKERGKEADKVRQKILQMNMARARTWFDKGRPLSQPLFVHSRHTGEEKILTHCPILEPVVDLDEVWFNSKTQQWELCINAKWFFQDNPGRPLIDDIGQEAWARVMGEIIDPAKYNSLKLALEGQIGGQTGFDVSTLFVYENYKQTDAALLEKLLMAGSMVAMQDHIKIVSELAGETHGKQSYSVPEYWANVVNHMVDDVVMSELYPSLYFQRYAGRAVESLDMADQWGRFMDYEIDQRLDYEATNTKGSWAELLSAQRVPPERRLRQMLMRNAYRPAWVHFSENLSADVKDKVSLEELLAYAGLREVNPGHTRKNAQGEETGYMELAIIEEAESRRAKKDMAQWKKTDFMDYVDPKTGTPSFYAQIMRAIDVSRMQQGKNPLEVALRQPLQNRFFQLNRIFSKWDLWKASRMVVVDYVDDFFRKHEEIPAEILNKKSPRYDRLIAQIVQDARYRKQAYDNKLWGDASRRPESLRWTWFEFGGKKYEAWDVWKRRQMVNKILREQQFPMGDEVSGKFMFTQWEDLEFLPNGDPNPKFHDPKLTYYELDPATGGIKGGFKYYFEDPNDRNAAMAWFDYEKRREEIWKKYEKVWDEAFKVGNQAEVERISRLAGQEIGEVPDRRFGTYKFFPGNGTSGLCPTLDLMAGWWEFQPETGLNERWPDYYEWDLAINTIGMWFPAYRMFTAQRLADVEYTHKEELKGKKVSLTPTVRKTDEYQEIYKGRLQEQLAISVTPAHMQNIVQFMRTALLKGPMDEKPARELGLAFGIENEEMVDNFYKLLGPNGLNWREGKVPPPAWDPEKMKELDDHFAHRRKEGIEGFKKFMLWKAMPETLEALPLVLGDDPVNLIDSGKTDKDFWGKWAARTVWQGVLPAATLTPLILGGYVLSPTFGSALLNYLTWAGFFSPAGLISHALGSAGWGLGKDRAEGNITDVTFKPFLFFGPQWTLVKSEDILKWQRGELKLSKALAGKQRLSLAHFMPAPIITPFYKPLAKQRWEQVEKGAAHTTWIDPSESVIKWVETMKTKFNKPKAG